MFESLLEKLLQKHLKDYIIGLDSTKLKLGVWNGNILIENVSINSKLIELFELPFQLIFSNIGRMNIAIPWNKLSSKPVEIILHDFLLILSIEKTHSFENDSKPRFLQEKLDFLTKIKEEFLKKISQKKTEKKPVSTSYIQKLSKLVFDNMQITINNIHIRIENQEIYKENRFSFGITLESLGIFTTDSQWKKNFLNRNEVFNKEKPINKRLTIKNLGIYWCFNEEIFYKKGENKEKTLILLENIVKNKRNLMLNINAEAKFVHNINTNNLEIPQNSLIIEMKPLKFVLFKPQLQQILRLIEAFQTYKAIFDKKTQENAEKYDKNSEKYDKNSENYNKNSEFEAKFLGFFSRIYDENYQCFIKENLIESDYDFLQRIPANILQKFTKIALKELQKKAFLSEQKTVKSWFSSWFFSEKSYSHLLSNEEKAQFLDFIEEIVKEDQLISSSLLRKPRDYVVFRIEILLEGGSLYIYQENAKNSEEGVNFGYKSLDLTVNISKNTKKIDVHLEDFFIEMVFSVMKCGFLMKNDLGNSQKSLNLMDIYYETSKSEHSSVLIMNIASPKIIYNPQMTRILSEFFKIKLENEEFKENAIEKLQELGDKTQLSLQSTLKDKKHRKIIFNLSSPAIIVPFLQNNSLTNECWLLQSGDLRLIYEPKSDKKAYELKLEQIKLEYFASLKLMDECYKKERREWKLGDQYFCLIEEFRIDVMLKRRKERENIRKKSWKNQEKKTKNSRKNSEKNEKFEKNEENREKNEKNEEIREKNEENREKNEENREKNEENRENAEKIEGIGEKPEEALLEISVDLPCLNMNLSNKIYRKLMRIKEHLIVNEENAMEIAFNERVELLKKAVKIGEVSKKITSVGITNWSKFFCVLSGNYLYFFIHQKDLNPHSNFYLKNVEILEIQDKFKSHVLQLRSRHAELILAFEKPDQKLSWLKILHSYLSQNPSQPPLSRRIKPHPKSYSQLKLSFSFKIPNINLNLLDSSHEIPKEISIKTSEFHLNLQVKEAFFSAEVLLSSLKVSDEKLSKEARDFIEHKAEKNQKELIKISALSLGYEHPDYKGINFECLFELGRINLNYNAISMRKILDFFVFKKGKKSDFPLEKNRLFSIKSQSSSDSLLSKNYSNFSPILLKIAVNIKEISFRFMDLLKGKSVFEVGLTQGLFELKKKSDEMEISGKLGNLQVLDHSKVVPFEILGLEQGKNSLCEVEFKRKEVSELDIKFNTIKIDLMVPSVKMIARYLKRNLIVLFEKNQRSFVNNENNEENEKKKKSRNLENFIISFEKPLILIKADYDTVQEFFVLNLGKIVIRRNFMRIVEENEAILEKTEVFMKDMDVIYYNKGEKEEFFKPFHLNMKLVKLKNSMEIKAKLSPIIINIKNSFLRIMQDIFHENLMKKKSVFSNENSNEKSNEISNEKSNEKTPLKRLISAFKLQMKNQMKIQMKNQMKFQMKNQMKKLH